MRKAEVFLEYQPEIPCSPVPPAQLHQQACTGDASTVNHWKERWIRQYKANHEKFGPFKERSIGQMLNEYKYMPVIVAGSGPSLKVNGDQLKDRGGIPLVSCLHNFHYMEERDLAPELYVTLDAGDITIEEVTEGGNHDEEWYWERTKDRTLAAYVGTHPDLLSKWRGKILFFNAPVPDADFEERTKAIEPFHMYVSNGGNVLGASMYISKSILGAETIIYVGADFSFGYDQKFHAWESKYDANMGNCVRLTDIYGNKVKTWRSYAGFAAWFSYVAQVVPGTWINCTEGGCLGSYPEGNIAKIRQMDLKDCFLMYNMTENLRENCTSPETAQKKILF